MYVPGLYSSCLSERLRISIFCSISCFSVWKAPLRMPISCVTFSLSRSLKRFRAGAGLRADMLARGTEALRYSRWMRPDRPADLQSLGDTDS